MGFLGILRSEFGRFEEFQGLWNFGNFWAPGFGDFGVMKNLEFGGKSWGPWGVVLGGLWGILEFPG